MFGIWGRIFIWVFLLGISPLVTSCSEVETIASTTPRPKDEGSIFLPEGTILKFKNDFPVNNKVDASQKIRLSLEHKGITAYKFKKISMNQYCDDPTAGTFGPVVTDDFYDFTPDTDGKYVICAVGKFESSGMWLSESRAVFSKSIVVDSTPPSNVGVSFDSAYTNNIFSTVYFQATDATKLGYSFLSCADISTFIAYTNRFPMSLVANSSNTIYVKYRDDLDNESSCVSATVVHDSIVPAAPVVTAPNLSNTYSRLQTDLSFEISCEPNATLKISGFFSDEQTCDLTGKYTRDVPTALLVEGDNNFSVYQVDRAGNTSAVTAGIVKYQNYVKGFALPSTEVSIDETAQTVSIPVTASEVSASDRVISYVIESEDTSSGSTYFTYYDVDGVTTKVPASYRVTGNLKIPAGATTANININWLGVAQSKTIAKMRVYLTGDQRREQRFVTDIFIKKAASTPKISKLAVSDRVLCSLLNGRTQVPCMGRSDIYQISATPGVDSQSADSFGQGAAPLDLAVGGQLSCIIDSTQKIVCRGLLYSGSSYSTPSSVQTMSGVGATSIAVGYAHVCGIFSDGLRCWGKPSDGQLGGVSSAPSLPSTPAVVNLGAGVRPVKVTAGNYHTCVLLEQIATPSIKTVKCFGNNIHGQLGNENLNSQGTTAGQMTSLPAVKFKAGRYPVDLYSGGYHNCAILDDGSVSCWGKNSYGQLGLGSESDIGGHAYTELETIDFKTTTAISKLALGENHSCALFVDKTVRCWGDNSYTQLGTGTMDNIGHTLSSIELWPSISIVNSGDIADLVVGGNISCVVYGSGDARCWGDNTSGQRGVPYLRTYNVARPVFGSTFYQQVSTAYNHTCAITQDGKLDCWGLSGAGLLGDGTNSVNYFPTGNAESRTFKSVAAGTTFSCAQTVENELYCWGLNNHRQLGAGLTVDYVTTPVKVQTNLIFTQFVVGAQHACGLIASGDVYCWGANDAGQLGLGDLVDRSSPTQVTSLSGISKLYAGLQNTCAVSGDGKTLSCWGANGGQMVAVASAATVLIKSPVVVVGPLSGTYQHIHNVSIYANHMCYISASWTDATKTAYAANSMAGNCRGSNGFAQIASSSTNPITSWSAIGNSYAWKAGVGATFTCLISSTTTNYSDMKLAGGVVSCKGDNTGGYLGINSTAEYSDSVANVVYFDNALTKVSTTIKVADLSVAGTHACAIERFLETPSGLYKNGRLFCWGNDKMGQMGDIEMAGFYRNKTLILKHLISR